MKWKKEEMSVTRYSRVEAHIKTGEVLNGNWEKEGGVVLTTTVNKIPRKTRPQRPMSAKNRIIQMLVDGKYVTSANATETTGCTRDYANSVLKQLYDAKKVYRGVLCDDRGNACGYAYTNRDI